MKELIIKHIKLRTVMVFLLSTVFILSSCEDVLDSAPDGKLSFEQVFSDPESVGAYLNSCYSMMPGKGYRYYQFTNFFDAVCDNGWESETVSTLPVPLMYSKEASASNHPFYLYSSNGIDDKGPRNSKFWDVYWPAIRKCAVFLKYIPTAKVADETTRNRWNAEAHILRAYYYLELIKLYGGNLPIEDEPYSFEADFSSLEQKSFYEIIQFIIDDCNQALNTNDLPWRITTAAEEFRTTKAVAEAIKSRAILYAASPLFNDGKNHWDEAYQITKNSVANLKANGYALYTNLVYPDEYLEAFDGNEYAALFNEYHTKKMLYQSGEADQETIWQNHSAFSQGLQLFAYQGIGFQYGGKTGINPSQELADAFETKDGEPILKLDNPYLDEKHLSPNYNTTSLYNSQDPYKNRDPRFYATIYHHLSHRKCFWAATEGSFLPGVRDRLITTNIEDKNTGKDLLAHSRTRTGYYHRKSIHPTVGMDSPMDIQIAPPVKLFRLAEMLLNFAEAAAENNKLTEALEAVNEVRARVGMPELPASLSKDQLILRIRNERRVELAYEEHRYFDVRRWSKPTDDLSKTDKWITAMEIKIDASKPTGYSYERVNIGPNARECWKSKNLLLPIPVEEASRLENITNKTWQRPGWK